MARRGTGEQIRSPLLEFGAMKLFADGALGGRTALLNAAVCG